MLTNSEVLEILRPFVTEDELKNLAHTLQMESLFDPCERALVSIIRKAASVIQEMDNGKRVTEEQPFEGGLWSS